MSLAIALCSGAMSSGMAREKGAAVDASLCSHDARACAVNNDYCSSLGTSREASMFMAIVLDVSFLSSVYEASTDIDNSCHARAACYGYV